MALMPIAVFAAGLGKLNVMSGLGEPLKADIELISVSAEELNSITAAIASEEAYTIQGIEKPASHNTIKVEVAKNASGTPVLKLKSTQPISEPFLDMLIQVDWASGRLLREYTVLLDPPGYTGETDSTTAQAPVVTDSDTMKGAIKQDATNGETAPSKPSSAKKSSSKPSQVEPAEEAMASDDASGQEHFTQSGDTLGKIAREMKPEGISLEQMLIGLYQTNPEAFQGNNINRLKVGQIIRQPSEETLNAISRNEAAKEIKIQTANWNAYRNKLAGIVVDSEASDANDVDANTQSAGGKIKSAAEDTSMPAATGPKDVVKLSAGDAAAAKSGANVNEIKSLENKITALQEEATAREKSVKEAQDKTASLEKQISDMQKLLEMKSGALADMQKQAETQAAAEKDKAAQVDVAKPQAEVPPAKPVDNAPQATKQADSEIKVGADAEKPKPSPAPVPVTETVPQQGFIDGILDGLNFGLLAPAGGLIALLAGGWLYLRKKRERSLADFEQGIMTSGGLKANTVFGNTASASVDTGDTSFLTDFSQSANGGMIDTHDVDPIAEAEVYMAYGRDAQAEEILKDAISKEPKRYELHLKLLEMYAVSKNVSAFETISGELYTTLGAEDPTWAKVAEIGIKLEPNNPLYQASGPAGNLHKSGDAGEKLDAADFSDSPLASVKDLDFSFDGDTLTQDFAPTGNAEGEKTSDMSFDLGPSTEPEAPAKADNTGAMNFDMGDLGSSEVETTPETESSPTEEFGHTMPGLDIPTFAMPQPALEPDSAEQSDELPALGEMTADAIEFPPMDEQPAEGVLDISGMETELTATETDNSNDFNFNINTIQPEVASAEQTDFSEPNAFDLTAIDLDLSDKTGAETGAETSTENASASANDSLESIQLENDAQPDTIALADNEPIEVDTKLELVVAYIEMDDKVGAKELLDEVMKEGGTNQRKRAEALLVKLA